MKKTLILTIVLLFSIQTNAQIAYYYQNIQKKHATIIIESDSTVIATKENDLLCGYFFTETGICNRIVMQWNNYTYTDLKVILNENENLQWSYKDEVWYTRAKGEDGNTYLIVTSIDFDSAGKPYVNIRINKKIN